MTLPSKTELQLGLPVPAKHGAVGPRRSSMFRKLAVQRLGLERHITVHTVLGVSGMIFLGSLFSTPIPKAPVANVSIPMIVTCGNCGAIGQHIGAKCAFCKETVVWHANNKHRNRQDRTPSEE